MYAPIISIENARYIFAQITDSDYSTHFKTPFSQLSDIIY